MPKRVDEKLSVQASTRLTEREGRALFDLAQSLSSFEHPIRPAEILRKALLTYAPFKKHLSDSPR